MGAFRCVNRNVSRACLMHGNERENEEELLSESMEEEEEETTETIDPTTKKKRKKNRKLKVSREAKIEQALSQGRKEGNNA